MSVGAAAGAATFGDDVAFLRAHVDTIVLGEGDAQVAVVPAWQGRVMTSTAGGDTGKSYGWINRELISSGEIRPHINVFGGEDRFWLGPEGGQFSIFFKGGDPFDLEHWQTPALIDTEPFALVSQSAMEAVFSRRATLTNYSGTTFDLRINRTIRLLGEAALGEHFGVALSAGLRAVGYESENRVTNVGDAAWEEDGGLLSIWILGMFNPSPDTTVLVPFKTGAGLGPIVNDAYFGKVPEDRLVERDGVLCFRGDGAYRSKIGVSPQRAKSVLGSYDAVGDMLTLVQYNKPENATVYVNSMWALQENPFTGDVVNAYNDGPPAPGEAPLGPFYELETSSPALALKPGESFTHYHRTLHVEGDEAQLAAIAQDTLGADLGRLSPGE